MRFIGGRVVKMAGPARTYEVVLEYEGAAPDTVHPVATVREGEALIRRMSPVLPQRDALRQAPRDVKTYPRLGQAPEQGPAPRTYRTSSS